jgi:hypothetical protein
MGGSWSSDAQGGDEVGSVFCGCMFGPWEPRELA